MGRSDRTIAPKQGRIAKAADEGIFAHSPCLAPGVALLTTATALSLAGEKGVEALLRYMKNGITHAATDRTAAGDYFLEALLAAARFALPLLLLVFTTSALASWTPAIWARRHRGRTAVPLPRRPNPRLARLTIRLLAGVLFVLLSVQILRDVPGSWSLKDIREFAWLPAGRRILQQMLFGSGSILLCVGLIEIALLRTAIFRALHLNSLEARREERAAGGDPKMKAEARRRSRATGGHR